LEKRFANPAADPDCDPYPTNSGRAGAAVTGAATSHLDSSYLASRTVLMAVREAMDVSAGLSVPTHRAVAS
jgi:hypothetical protein